MSKVTKFGGIDTIGLDVGDRSTHFCEVRDGKVIAEGRFDTRLDAFEAFVRSKSPCRIVLEVGSHSPWMNDVMSSYPAFETIVANPARLLSVRQQRRKTDKIDARYLASRGSLGDVNVTEAAVNHRSREVRATLTLIRARDAAVDARRQIVTTIRGLVKPFAARLPKSSTESFVRPKVIQAIPKDVFPSIAPLLPSLESLNASIRQYDKEISKIVRKTSPQVAPLTEIRGVGDLTALTFALTIGDVQRFKRARAVGSYLGLVPAMRQSGDSDPKLGITKEGDKMLRRYLVQAAHHILGRSKVDSDLRRFGESIMARDADHGRKRAVIAVARKLAVLMFHLLKSGKPYDPLHHQTRTNGEVAA